jgi:hypothetical protein
MVRYDIQQELADTWRPVIERHLALSLASAMPEITTLKVGFRRTGGGLYDCTVQGRDAGGRRLDIHTSDRDGREAVTQAFARAKREMARKTLRSTTSA